jgi:hypothetical protein
VIAQDVAHLLGGDGEEVAAIAAVAGLTPSNPTLRGTVPGATMSRTLLPLALTFVLTNSLFADTFRRDDTNGNRIVAIRDALGVLGYVFLG